MAANGKKLGFGFEKAREGETNDWLTPPEVLKRLGHFDLDPCSCKGMPWRTADTMYTLPQNDGLKDPWFGRVFCNPPYGPHVNAWAKRMAEHGNGVMLIFSRTEVRAWYETIWPFADAILFPHGRMHFYLPNGTRAAAGMAPSSLIAYGQGNVDSLRSAGIAGALVLKAEILRGTIASKF